LSFAQAGVGYGLARETSGENVDGLDLAVVDGGDVAVVWDAGEARGHDLGGVLVLVGLAVLVRRFVLRTPSQFGVQDGRDGHAQAAVAGAEFAEAQRHGATSWIRRLNDR
jgi:hypothetical protein